MNIHTVRRRYFGHGCFRLLALTITAFAAWPGDVFPQSDEEVRPSEVFAAVQDFAEELETWRLFMGAPKSNRLTIEIRDAAPHDVYFQALTLFEKANRLSFELIRVQNDPPPTRAGVQTPADVLKVVSAAGVVLHQVLGNFGLPADADIILLVPKKTPSNVFEAIRQVNRQLNIMLEQHFSPSDVYMQVTFAVGYASNLLVPFYQVPRIPDEPPLEPGKMPRDAFFRIVECLEIIAKIYQINGLKSLRIDVSKADPDHITPSDVYDMASLVVARLDYLQKLRPDIEEPLPPFYPGRKFPSDVYQRAGLLKLQLEELAAQSGKPLATSP